MTMTGRGWRQIMFGMFAMCLCAMAEAASLRYTIDGTGSLTLGATDYTDVDFRFTLIGEPSGLGFAVLPLSSATLSLSGAVDALFLGPTRLGINSANVVFFARNEALDISDLFDFTVPVRVDLAQPFGPVTGVGVFGLNQFIEVPTSLGALTFLSSSDVQFAATAVPLPASLPLLAGAVAMVVVRRRAYG
jgi:hypothetical protein